MKIKDKFPFSIVLFLIICLYSCSIPRWVTLNETFEQSFNFKTGESLTDLKLKALLTDEVYNALENQDGVFRSIKSNNVVAQGIVNLKFSVNPKNNMKFFISGNGNYEILDTTLNKPYFSANFRIDSRDNHFEIEDLKEDTLPIFFNQTLRNYHFKLDALEINRLNSSISKMDTLLKKDTLLTKKSLDILNKRLSKVNDKIDKLLNHFEIYSFETESPLKIIIKLKNFNKKNKLISLSYDVSHKVKVYYKNRYLDVGDLNFTPPLKEWDNIIDLRWFRLFKPYKENKNSKKR